MQSEWIGDGLLTIPSSVTKNKREHAIPLTQECARYAHLLVALDPSDRAYNTWSKPKAELDTRSGVSNWVIHDLRRTVSTNLAELNVAPHVIDRILNHATGTLHRTYNRYQYLTEMRAALEVWEGKLLAVVGAQA